MAYLLTQIILCLTGVALLGVALGWLFGNSLSRGRMRTAEATWREHVAQAEAQAETVRERLERQDVVLADSRSALEDKDAAYIQLRDRFESAQRELNDARVKVNGLEFEMEGVRSRLSDAEYRLADATGAVEARERRLEAAEEAVSKAEARAAEIGDEAVRLRKRLTELEPVVRLHEALRTKHRELQTENATLRRQVSELRQALRRERGRPMATPTLGSHLRAVSDAPDEVEAVEDRPIHIRPAAGPRRPMRIASGPSDDLKRIHGIGHILERKLKALGYRTVGDIAAMTAEDIGRVSGELGAFADRIERDRWVDQARRIMEEGG